MLRFGARALGKTIVVLFAVIGVIASIQEVRGQNAAPLAGATFNHVGIVVADINKTRKAFEETFGITVPPAREFGPLSLPKEVPNAANSLVSIVSFPVGNMTIELLQPLRGPGPHKDFLERCGQGLQHISFGVKDLEAAMAPLEARGVKRVMRGYADLTPTLGFMAELNQMPAPK